MVKLILYSEKTACRCEALRSSLCVGRNPGCFEAKAGKDRPNAPRNDIQFVSSMYAILLTTTIVAYFARFVVTKLNLAIPVRL